MIKNKATICLWSVKINSERLKTRKLLKMYYYRSCNDDLCRDKNLITRLTGNHKKIVVSNVFGKKPKKQ